MFKVRFLIPLFFLVAALGLRATTVIPPDFPGLVAGADAIYRGRVAAVESRRIVRPNGSTSIRTYVTFTIERTLKGAARADVTLDFLGGTVDGLTLEVSDVPHFAVGDHDIVFVQGNGRQFCPLVGVMHGRYRIAHDAATNRDFVTRNNQSPLLDVKDVGQPMGEHAASVTTSDQAHALSVADFETQVVRQVAAGPLQNTLR